MQGEAKGRIALVTGAGSPTGIGFACARILGREGASVAVCSTTERIHERVGELREAGMVAEGYVADLTDREQATRVIEAVVERFGRIDILVNNAGMVNVGLSGSESKPFLEMTDDEWDLDIGLNLGTAYNVTRAALPRMVASGWGRVVMVSSVTGPLVTDPGSSGYSAAKAGMDGMMRGIAIEVASSGVTVNSVAPGWIASGSQTEDEADAGFYTPVGRSGRPDEVGEVVAFRMSSGTIWGWTIPSAPSMWGSDPC
jgi:3-oxoacyl-[acyl-carrier protein] reductase